MKKLCLLFMAALCLVLGGCGTKSEEKAFREFSEALAARDDLSFIGSIRAEYDDRTVEFQLRYEEEEDCPSVTVISPSIISGVRVELPEGKSVLEYNSLVIDTGELDVYGLSPLTALPSLADALRRGYTDSIWQDDGEWVFSLIPKDELRVDVWFEPESMTPTHAELISDGVVRVFCDIESWR